MKSMIYIGVFVVYFGFIIITSLMSAKKVETMSDFTTGGNKMGLLLGVGTSMATWLSVASVMGVPGNIYSRGVCAVFGWVARLVPGHRPDAPGGVQDPPPRSPQPHLPRVYAHAL